MAVLVNLRGCNGSGKSSIIHSIMKDPERYIVTRHFKHTKTGELYKDTVFTVFPSFGVVAIGSYERTCGGVDALNGNNITSKTKRLIKIALKSFEDFDYIFVEGIIMSTVTSTWVDFFLELKQLGHEVVVISLSTPLNVCLQRIYKRNGGKPIKEELVEGKYKSVKKSHRALKASGISCVTINSVNYTKERAFEYVRNKLNKRRNK